MLNRGDGSLAVIVALAAIVLPGVPVASASTGCPNEDGRAGASGSLPDCRAYELVSPVDKGGFSAYNVNNGAPPAQVAPGGNGIAYLDNSAFPGAEGNNALFAAHVSLWDGQSWRTQEITPPRPTANEAEQADLSSYYFSSDLSQSIVQLPEVLTPEATPLVFNLFLRHPNGSYSWVNDAPPVVAPEAICPTEFVSLCQFIADRSMYAGGSRDFSHVLFESTAQLTKEAPPTFVESLYENADGKVRLVGILPDAQPAATSTAGAGSSSEYISNVQETDRRVENAISQDGARAVFEAPADEGGPDTAQNGLTEVYDRIDGQETIELSAPGAGATPKTATAEPAKFWGASPDGGRVFFTSSAELTTQSNTGTSNNTEDLYEYRFGPDGKSGTLTDLTVDTNASDASTGAGVLGVVGSGESESGGSYVYFLATGQLVPGEGVDGEPNLYVVHDGTPRFIATLSPATDSGAWSEYPDKLTAYVTPDGQHVAFMSGLGLHTANFPAGYNNVDRHTGQPDSEVYVYDAETARLLCASCDPSGAAPNGNALLGGLVKSFSGNETLGLSTPFYRVPAMSATGSRVFFATTPFAEEEASTPFVKIYEYEQSGEGTCAIPMGCMYLISNNASPGDDTFLGTDETGDSVFLATAASVAPADKDNLVDIYDARAGGRTTVAPAQTTCQSACQSASASETPMSSLLTAVTGPSGNLKAPFAVSTRKKGPSSNKDTIRRRNLAKCRKRARRHSSPRIKRRALRQCAKRYGSER